MQYTDKSQSISGSNNYTFPQNFTANVTLANYTFLNNTNPYNVSSYWSYINASCEIHVFGGVTEKYGCN